MVVITIIAVKVGAAPDACGTSRNLWLMFVPEAVKESVE
jgi:hypothetical protein